MKFIWEESDIVPGTQLKHKHGEQYFICITTIKEISEDLYIIGYDPQQEKVYMIISLVDGRIICTGSSYGITEFLNGFGYIPL